MNVIENILLAGFTGKGLSGRDVMCNVAWIAAGYLGGAFVLAAITNVESEFGWVDVMIVAVLLIGFNAWDATINAWFNNGKSKPDV